MLIVLEGPDGSGKTTLANELRRLGCSYIHCTNRYMNHMFTYHTAVMLHALSLAVKTEKPCILDRWWPSEYIYGRQYRDGTKFPHYGRLLDRMLLTFGGLYVWCVPGDASKYRKQFIELTNTRHEVFKDPCDMMDVRRGYLRLLKGDSNYKYGGYFDTLTSSGGVLTRADCSLYDVYEHGKYVNLFANGVIETCLNQRYLKSIRWDNLNPPAVGNFDADVILVGDKPNLKWGPRRPTWPFFEHGNCSLYLCKILDELKVPETKLCYVNINQSGGVPTIADWLSRRGGGGGYGSVILFGNDVERTFVDNFPGTAYYGLPHPSAARRFPSYNKLFVKKLREVLC